jgi:polysaccharide pyruvyl transferase WcaK-like protein
LDICEDLDWRKLRGIVEELDIDYAIADESEKDIKVNLMNNSKTVQYSVAGALEQIWGCRIIIAMRYHVILAAAANGIPVLPIAYCPKVTQLAKQSGICDFEVSVYEIDKIEEKFKRLYTNSEQIKEELHAKHELMKNKADVILCHISQTIKQY